MGKILELRDVWFRYPGSSEYALRGVSLSAGGGTVTAIVGPNGAGKTTLLLVSAGLLEPERGSVLFMGRSLGSQLPGARRYIGVLFQNPESMLFNPTVYDEIAFVPRQIYGCEEEVREAVVGIADRLGIPRSMLDRQVHTLSYGFKKLVALASILVYRPKLILLDEPYASLSEEYIDIVRGVIRERVREGAAVVIASHDRSSISGADTVYTIKNGLVTGRLLARATQP